MFNGNYGLSQYFLLNKMKTGRPILQESQKKAKITGLRLRREEREMLENAAGTQKKKLSDWMRGVLLENVKKCLEAAA